jgi:hypothetical protein
MLDDNVEIKKQEMIDKQKDKELKAEAEQKEKDRKHEAEQKEKDRIVKLKTFKRITK